MGGHRDLGNRDRASGSEVRPPVAGCLCLGREFNDAVQILRQLCMTGALGFYVSLCVCVWGGEGGG